ncbi:MAG: hypothetical protein GDA56_14375 [Hormoscilla sp. GM7CHS1pb]|nr:hypothetical protein [Hormoscilla sp. GM7CHS1pb]
MHASITQAQSWFANLAEHLLKEMDLVINGDGHSFYTDLKGVTMVCFGGDRAPVAPDDWQEFWLWGITPH